MIQQISPNKKTLSLRLRDENFRGTTQITRRY